MTFFPKIWKLIFKRLKERNVNQKDISLCPKSMESCTPQRLFGATYRPPGVLSQTNRSMCYKNMWSSWTSGDKTEPLHGNIIFFLSSFVSFKGRCVLTLYEIPVHLLIMKFSLAMSVINLGVCHTWSLTHTDIGKEDAAIYISVYYLNFSWLWLIYNVVLASNVQQCDSVCMCCFLLYVVARSWVLHSRVLDVYGSVYTFISGFTCWFSGKESTCKAGATGDWGSIPGSGRFPGGGHGNPQEIGVQSLAQEDSLEEDMATHSSILTWKTPWTEEPGRLQSMGLQRVRQGHDWRDLEYIHAYVNPNSLIYPSPHVHLHVCFFFCQLLPGVLSSLPIAGLDAELL